MEQAATTYEYVCAKCGHEQDSMDRLCDKCSSFRVILISVAEGLLGADWRRVFDPNYVQTPGEDTTKGAPERLAHFVAWRRRQSQQDPQ